MSPQWIEVDDEVMALVKTHAEPFVDGPNDALRRALGLKPAGPPTCALWPSTRPPQAPARARSGELVPLAEYELPVLKAISEAGGSAWRSQVKEAVGAQLAERLTGLDSGRLKSGEVRWENRLGFARRRLIERGQLRAGSPRGLWELTGAGFEELRRRETDETKERTGEAG